MRTNGSDIWSVSDEGWGSLTAAAREPAVVLDGDGRILSWNHAAEQTFGYGTGDAVGAVLGELLRCEGLDARLDAEKAPVSAAARPRVSLDAAGLRVTACDGREVLVEMTVAAVITATTPRFVVFLDDVSGRREVALGRRRFEAIVTSSADAIMSTSPEGVIESWNLAAERLYGYRADEIIGSSAGRLRPSGTLGDMAEVAEAMAAGRPLSLETRDRHKDGSLIDVAVALSPLRDDDGDVVGVVSVIRDITERNRATARLTEANSRFARAFDAASTGMALVAPDGRFLDVNPALCRMLQRDRDALRECSLAEITHPDDLTQSIEQLRRARAGEIDTAQQQKRYLLPDGGIIWALKTFTVARDDDGAVQHFIAQIEDITQRKTAEHELQRYSAHLQALSEQDPVTGLLNRPAFDARLRQKLRRLSAGESSVTVMLVDVKNGDSAIDSVADSLTRASRGDDLIARVGEHELAVLVPGVGEDEAVVVIRRMTNALAHHPGVHTSHITADPQESVDTLLDQARARLTQDSTTNQPSEQISPAIRRLLETTLRQLGMGTAFLARVEGDGYAYTSLTSNADSSKIASIGDMPLNHTVCERMLDGRAGMIVADLAADPETRDVEITKRMSLRAYAGVPVRLSSGECYGTICAVDTRPHPELGVREVDLLHFLAELAAEHIEHQARQETARQTEASATGVRTLLTALEARDFYTGEHSKEVVALASAVARHLGLNEDVIRDIEQVALLHDIGKVGIPDAILQKQGPLDAQEWELMRQHPVVGERIIAGTPGLAHLAPAMRAEHERWDGTGYPDQLVGEQIPIASRITLACDALHAMTSDRPYRPAMTLQHARNELYANAGSQFDPRITRALLAELATRSPPPNPDPTQTTTAPPGTTTARLSVGAEFV